MNNCGAANSRFASSAAVGLYLNTFFRTIFCCYVTLFLTILYIMEN